MVEVLIIHRIRISIKFHREKEVLASSFATYLALKAQNVLLMICQMTSSDCMVPNRPRLAPGGQTKRKARISLRAKREAQEVCPCLLQRPDSPLSRLPSSTSTSQLPSDNQPTGHCSLENGCSQVAEFVLHFISCFLLYRSLLKLFKTICSRVVKCSKSFGRRS